jgi:hypothetical protein
VNNRNLKRPSHSSNELDYSTRLCHFLLGLCGNMSRAENELCLRQTTFSKQFRVAERKEVNPRYRVRIRTRKRFLAFLSGNQRPELGSKSVPFCRAILRIYTHLVDVDGALPLCIWLEMEMAHSNLSKVAWVVEIEICT